MYRKEKRCSTLCILLLVFSLSILAGCDGGGDGAPEIDYSGLVINEIVSNPLCETDYIEIYNGGTESVDIKDCYIADSSAVSDSSLNAGALNDSGHRIVSGDNSEDTVIEPGAFTVILFNNTASTGASPLQVQATLDASEAVVFCDSEKKLIDSFNLDGALSGLPRLGSWSRTTDGSGNFANALATRGYSNGSAATIVSGVNVIDLEEGKSLSLRLLVGDPWNLTTVETITSSANGVHEFTALLKPGQPYRILVSSEPDKMDVSLRFNEFYTAAGGTINAVATCTHRSITQTGWYASDISGHPVSFQTARDVTISGSGAIFIAGSATMNSSANEWGAFLIKLFPGTLKDSSFGTNGIVTATVSGAECYGKSTALSSDGVFLAGDGWENKEDLYLWKYTSTGNLDSGFNSGTVLTVSGSGGYSNMGRILVVSEGSDEYVMVPGMLSDKLYLAKVDASDGSVSTSYTSSFDGAAYAVSKKSDGSFFVAGTVKRTQGSYNHPNNAIFKFTSSLALDTTWGRDIDNADGDNDPDTGRDGYILLDSSWDGSSWSLNGHFYNRVTALYIDETNDRIVGAGIKCIDGGNEVSFSDDSFYLKTWLLDDSGMAVLGTTENERVQGDRQFSDPDLGVNGDCFLVSATMGRLSLGNFSANVFAFCYNDLKTGLVVDTDYNGTGSYEISSSPAFGNALYYYNNAFWVTGSRRNGVVAGLDQVTLWKLVE